MGSGESIHSERRASLHLSSTHARTHTLTTIASTDLAVKEGGERRRKEGIEENDGGSERIIYGGHILGESGNKGLYTMLKITIHCYLLRLQNTGVTKHGIVATTAKFQEPAQ